MSSCSRSGLDNIKPVLLGLLPEYVSQLLSSSLSRLAEDLRRHGCLSSSVWKGDRRRFDTIAWLIGILSAIRTYRFVSGELSASSQVCCWRLVHTASYYIATPDLAQPNFQINYMQTKQASVVLSS